MFLWDETITKLDVPAANVIKLLRSMRDVQMALPGLPSQEASAYLCQFRKAEVITTVAVFHLQRSRQLAYYFSNPREVNARKADRVFDEGLNFVESMGFLLTDMDIEQLNEADREMLWESLPIQSGTDPAAKQARAETSGPEKSADLKPLTETSALPGDESAAIKSGSPQKRVEQEKPMARSTESSSGGSAETSQVGETEEEVDELLAVVQSLRARRPGMLPGKKQPTPAEMTERRLKFKENLGRILASH